MAGADWTRPELILAVALRETTGWAGTVRRGDPRVVELSQFLRAANPALAFDQKFRSPGSVRAKLENLRTSLPTYEGKKTKAGRPTEEVIASYLEDAPRLLALAGFIRANPSLLSLAEDGLSDGIDVIVDLDDVEQEGITTALEGAVGRRWAAVRERNPKLRRAKIRESLRVRGSIACEICGFDFEKVYGTLGAGYTHVHHRVPLHITGEVKNDLSDLILVCANCHAMVHRNCPWKRPDEIQEIIAAAATAD
ncbi:HNH endonuclease [Gordonia caeni]|uniref:HNH nuclease domain-containing protein n=1 Tax=Gordonia caeni TaxID=1007097 RepID=A0ABP7PH01_9ACTN